MPNFSAASSLERPYRCLFPVGDNGTFGSCHSWATCRSRASRSTNRCDPVHSMTRIVKGSPRVGQGEAVGGIDDPVGHAGCDARFRRLRVRCRISLLRAIARRRTTAVHDGDRLNTLSSFCLPVRAGTSTRTPPCFLHCGSTPKRYSIDIFLCLHSGS